MPRLRLALLILLSLALPLAARPAGKGVMFLPQDQRDQAFRAMETVAPTRTVAANGSVRTLPPGPPLALRSDPDAFMTGQHAAALIILHKGRIRLERYALGLGPKDRWVSFSVTKSITSTLLGAALRDGAIHSLDDPITRYIPDLKDSAYDPVTIRQLLTMTSGVRWNEDYADPGSDVARLDFQPPTPGLDITVSYMRTLTRATKSGKRWHYNTGEANLLGVLVSNATGQTLSRYASQKIWTPFGMEAPATWVLGSTGHEIGGCCLSARPRDLARFGQFVLEGGKGSVPKGWFAQATSAQAQTGLAGRNYGFQWWAHPDGSFAALGIFGQTIFIDPARQLVVVIAADWPSALDSKRDRARSRFLREVQSAIDQNPD